MRALQDYAFYLLVLHGAWAMFYAYGTVLRTPRFGLRPGSGAFGRGGALVEIVVSTATGIAIVGLMTFVLGIAHLLYPATILVFPIVLVAALAYAGDPPWRAEFWRTRAAVWATASSAGALAVYAAMLYAGFASIRPDIGSDATAYHVPYGIFWAHVHSLAVNLTLQNPFYANNWVLLDVWLAEFHLVIVTQSLSWFAGLLTVLGVYGFVRDAGERRAAAPRVTEAVALLAALSIGLSAIFLHWIVAAMIDVPIGLFFLACALAFAGALRTRRPAALAELILCAGFFIGMKVSLIAFYPLFVCAVVLAALALRLPRRATVIALVALTVVAAPWYAKNLVQTGDPVPPIFDLALYGHDPKYAPRDAPNGNKPFLTAELQGAGKRLGLPLAIVTNPQDPSLREFGSTLIIVFLWTPGVLAAYILLRRRVPLGVETCALATFVVYAVGYWLGTIYASRYTLTFTPLLAVLAGALALRLSARFPRVPAATVAAIAAVALCAIPSTGNVAFAQEYLRGMQDTWDHYADLEQWMVERTPAYRDVEYISDALHRSGHTDLAVYQYSMFETRQYFAERDITVQGDYYGPERFTDFVAAAHNGKIADYFAMLHVGALLVPTYATWFTPPDRQLLAQQLAAMHWKHVVLEPNYEVWLAPQVAPAS